jgi:chromosome segregation ATPase
MKTKIETPRSNAAAEGALKMLTACKSSGDFKTAVKSIVECMLDLCKDLESELAERKTMCDERLAHIATQNDRISLAETHVKALQKDIETMKYLEDESQHGVDELRRKLDEAETKLAEYMRDNATICYQCAHAEPANE